MATCTDVVKNSTETDVDCGGATCGACADTKTCALPGDCTSGVCTATKCAVPTCLDTVKNGTESDVDCGGATCGKCALGKVCGAATDCTANVECGANVCALPETCKTLRAAFPAATDGVYKIDPDGAGAFAAIDVWCDMTADGGGWTMVLVNNSTPPAVAPTFVNATTAVTNTGAFGPDLSLFNQLVGLQWWTVIGSELRLEAGASHAALTHKSTHKFTLDAADFYRINLTAEVVLLGGTSPGLSGYHNNRSSRLSTPTTTRTSSARA